MLNYGTADAIIRIEENLIAGLRRIEQSTLTLVIIAAIPASSATVAARFRRLAGQL
jgi:hypothetical protein